MQKAQWFLRARVLANRQAIGERRDHAASGKGQTAYAIAKALHIDRLTAAKYLQVVSGEARCS